MELKLKKEELENEMNKCKQNWEREKDGLLHKVRQDEKVRGMEIDALQQKFTSRMTIMENTNKSLHSQVYNITGCLKKPPSGHFLAKMFSPK
jgi:hypothetical protein